jgi:hypothetical protein
VSIKRITVYIEDAGEEPSREFVWMQAWLARWVDQVRVADYSSGGWEHVWDLEGPQEAVEEVPAEWLCSSEWATPDLFRT